MTRENGLDFSGTANVLARELTAGILLESLSAFMRRPDGRGLVEAIAAHENTQQENVFPANGAPDLFRQFLLLTEPRSVLFVGPAHPEYTRLCRTAGIACQVLAPAPASAFACGDLELREMWETEAELAVVSAVNGISGAAQENMSAILASLRAPRILVDLSFREFLYGAPGYLENSWNHYRGNCHLGGRVFCLHSFSHFFCCPGLRLAYLLGEALITRKLRERQPSAWLHSIGQAAGALMLSRLEAYRATLPRLRENIYELGMELRRMPLFQEEGVLEGPDFFCCALAENTPGELLRRDGGRLESADVRRFLLKRGFNIRDCDGFAGMPKGYIRILARSAEENRALECVLLQA
jgi:threonine-phosphate decarboxylase